MFVPEGFFRFVLAVTHDPPPSDRPESDRARTPKGRRILVTYRTLSRSLAWAAGLSILAAAAVPAMAQDATAAAVTEAVTAATQPAAAATPDTNTGSTAWMLVSAALVLFM